MISEEAVISSQVYYKYITKNGKGIAECQVKKIDYEKGYYELTLYNNLKQIDSAQIRIDGIIYSHEQIKPIKWNSKSKVLTVRAVDEGMEALKSAIAMNACVVSNLSFLIERVGEWYKKFGNKVILPTTLPKVKFCESYDLCGIPSQDQTDAIFGVLSSPLSYVWGAPGTGKTRFVLARCVLSYKKPSQLGKALVVSPCFVVTK